MKKSERIEAEIGGAYHGPLTGHPCYTGWFEEFNAGRYYEAHDVLEHLWLQTEGANHAFFKGLIQLAGAFVHLRKQFEHPSHPKHGRRLRPAGRLFQLAHGNLETYAPTHLRLDVNAVLRFIQKWFGALESSEFESNPWSPEARPVLHLSNGTE